MREAEYQHRLIKKIRNRFPDAMILKNDPDYIQGVPDLLILNDDKWAALEVKRSARAPHRPNQDHYVSKMDDMSFARFIYPENEKEILDELQQAFRSDRETCLPVSEQV